MKIFPEMPIDIKDKCRKIQIKSKKIGLDIDEIKWMNKTIKIFGRDQWYQVISPKELFYATRPFGSNLEYKDGY